MATAMISLSNLQAALLNLKQIRYTQNTVVKIASHYIPKLPTSEKPHADLEAPLTSRASAKACLGILATERKLSLVCFKIQ